MLGPVRRIVPAPLKRALRSKVNDVANRTDLSGRVEGLANQVRNLESFRLDLIRQVQQLQDAVNHIQGWVNEFQPEVYRPAGDVRRQLDELLTAHGVDASRFEPAVSKNDVMFQFLVQYYAREPGAVGRAFLTYTRSGLHMMQVLEAIVRRKFGSFDRVDGLLDFASGYARLTRFLALAMDPARIWVSDIKPGAVEFSQRHFGVPGFVSTEAPEDLSVERRFDLVFVASLFSHLPEETFGRWLQRMCDLLSPSGLLVFSVPHSDQIGTKPPSGISFRPVNEEGMTLTVDHRLDPNGYGTTHCTEGFVQRAIRALNFENKNYVRYGYALWFTQDVYLLSRDPADDLTGMTLPT